MELVQSMAGRIEKRWGDAGRNHGALREIAREVLQETPALERGGLDEVLATLVRCEVLPTQAAGGAGTWGDPPVTVYNGEDFFIDVYFFLEPTLSIHSHSFSGAFTLLSGRSAHTTFRFDETGRQDESFLFGQLRPDATEILSVGEVREIPRGLDLIHNVTHLSEPTVSLVVRTAADDDDVGIYAFFPPGLGVRTSDYLDESAAKKIRLLEMMCRLGDPRAVERIGIMIDHAEDLHAAWFAWRYFELSRDLDLLQELLSARPRCERAWAAPLVAAARRGAMAPVEGFGGLDERARLRLAMDVLLDDPVATEQAIDRFDQSCVRPASGQVR